LVGRWQGSGSDGHGLDLDEAVGRGEAVDAEENAAGTTGCG
jgi:hypothetical protein